MQATINEIDNGRAEVVITFPDGDAAITAQVVLDEGFLFYMTSAVVVVTKTIRPALSADERTELFNLGAEVAINRALTAYYAAHKQGMGED